MSGDGELMMTILASLAQEESRSISENVRWRVKKRFEKGIPNGHFRIYGYRWEDDQLVVIPSSNASSRISLTGSPGWKQSGNLLRRGSRRETVANGWIRISKRFLLTSPIQATCYYKRSTLQTLSPSIGRRTRVS